MCMHISSTDMSTPILQVLTDGNDEQQSKFWLIREYILRAYADAY